MLMWLNGRYTQQALLSTVCNAEFWHKKGQPPNEYPQKPFFDENVVGNQPKYDENGDMILTEEEKAMWRKRLFMGLKIKQANFEANKREGGE